MIIKKKKNNAANDDTTQDHKPFEQSELPPEPKVDDSLFSVFQSITERQERRRGDRRRGYRRVEDRNLISRAQEESNLIRENAAKEGFQIGIENAEAEIQNLKSAIASIAGIRDEAYRHYMNDISFIAIKVAEKIIKTEVACDETIVLRIISEVLKDIGKDESRIIIRISPYDMHIVNEKMPEFFSFGGTKVNMYIEEDDSVDQGSCIVQTTSGQINANFTTQLEILQKVFETELREK